VESRNRSNKNLKLAEKFRPLLTDLYWAANNPNKVGAAPGQVMVTKMDGWEFGCKVEEVALDTFRRKVFVRPEQPFITIPRKEKDPILAIVFDVMFDKSAPADEVSMIAPNCLMMSQMFIPALLQKTDTAIGHIKINDKALDETGKVVH
jgi:hypothetical protein